MNDTKNAMPNLFRSLRPDAPEPPSVGASSAMAVDGRPHKGESLWPILNSVLPKKSLPTVPLTDQEKLQRCTVSLTAVQLGRVGSSLPGTSASSVSRQLAGGLARMLDRPSTMAPANPADASAPGELPIVESVGRATFESPPVDQPEAPNSLAVIETTLFRKREASALAPPEIEPLSPANDESLVAVFRRIEQAHQAAPTSSRRPPAFLSRLGKR